MFNTEYPTIAIIVLLKQTTNINASTTLLNQKVQRDPEDWPPLLSAWPWPDENAPHDHCGRAYPRLYHGDPYMGLGRSPGARTSEYSPL